MADQVPEVEGYEFDEDELAAGESAVAARAAEMEALRQSDPAAYEAEIKKHREWLASLNWDDTPSPQPESP